MKRKTGPSPREEDVMYLLCIGYKPPEIERIFAHILQTVSTSTIHVICRRARAWYGARSNYQLCVIFSEDYKESGKWQQLQSKWQARLSKPSPKLALPDLSPVTSW